MEDEVKKPWHVYYDSGIVCDKYVESSVCHDGTLLFEVDCLYRCLYKAMEYGGENITIGKIEYLNEYDDDRRRFTPKDKPWCTMRTTYRVHFKMEENCK